MNLPASLVEKVKRGKAILFLGSGALVGAEIPGKTIPLGDGLRDLLNDQFLDGEYASDSLAHVAALAISQNSLFDVQDFIGDYFCGLRPASFHYKIPEFKWRALFTTNYDRLIEICYEESADNLQDFILILSNSDRFDETRTTNDKVPLIKLHGCITRTHEESLPLILTVDQYDESLESRSRLFNHLFELAYENTIIFIGHKLQDSNLRSILLKLHKEAPQGQRHYFVKPDIKQVESDYWAEKKITSVNCTFEEFMTLLDKEVSRPERLLSLVRPVTTHPIQERFTTKSKPSEDLLRFLTDNVEYISNNSTFIQCVPKEFYKGADQGWFPMAEGLSIMRTLGIRIRKNVIEKPEVDRKSKAELFVIKGEAGSGKTILLRQIAWDAKDLGIGIFIWVKSGAWVDLSVIGEITKRTSERVFLIWDDAARNSKEISRCFSKARKDDLSVTILTAERFSEWNTRCTEIDDLVTGVYKLPYLSETEITDLIGKLEKYDCLGPNLTPKNDEERKRQFKEKYGRQLLVALYEATMGEPFEDIIFDEFSKISPQGAKDIYRTVCTLNRMRVPVRAGLISRIYGISFEKFQQHFFKPLEKVVLSESYNQSDVHYKARHPEIAEIVFKRALSDIVDRYDEYIRILSKLNISFESDRSSFRTMIRAKSLHELFPNYEDVQKIYEFAKETIGNDAYLFQQIANFERIRPNGNLNRAMELLDAARKLAPYDNSINHSLAVLWRDRASATEEPAAKIKFRGEARTLLRQMVRKGDDNGYVSCTLVDLALDDLGDLIGDENATDRSIDLAVREAERELLATKRKFPSDEHVFRIEARFAEIIEDERRVIAALEKSFSPSRDPFVATRLSTIYKASGDTEKAIRIVRLALERRSSDHRLNFHYAELLRKGSESKIEDLVYYYRRAYTPKDHHYQAQFWDARFSYELDDPSSRQRSDEIFDELRNAKLPFESKIKIRDQIGSSEAPHVFVGTLNRKIDGYGFITVDGRGNDIFFSGKDMKDNLWDALQEGDRMRFNIGFSFGGPVCCNVEVT